MVYASAVLGIPQCYNAQDILPLKQFIIPFSLYFILKFNTVIKPSLHPSRLVVIAGRPLPNVGLSSNSLASTCLGAQANYTKVATLLNRSLVINSRLMVI